MHTATIDSRVIDNFPTFYPIKITSRSIARRRTRRVSYLALGLAFGLSIGISVSFAPSQKSSAIAAQIAPAPIIAAQTKPVAVVPTPVAAPATIAVAQHAPAPPVKPKAAPALYPLTLDLKVASGDTLTSLLTDAGVSIDEANNVVESIRPAYNPKKLDIGQTVRVKLDKSPNNASAPVVTSLSMLASKTTTLELTRRQNDTFTVKKADIPTEVKLARAGGRIDSSLYETAVGSGLPPALVSEIIAAYSYDIDFQREVKEGDTLDVLFERMQTKEGRTTGHGNVIFASIDMNGRHLKIYRYTDKFGHADYYNEKGESVRKALLKTPINGARITSGYGMRNHPILGYSKMHRGVDFGAPTGTPIYAAGDGVVAFEGRKGGYGNYLRINHNAKYASAYGHISRFAAGIHPGSKVKQGQVVAYVGMTGMATGPHLHYEILVNNEQVNPNGVKFKTGNVLGGKELLAFRQSMRQIQTQLAYIPRAKTDVAMLDNGDGR